MTILAEPGRRLVIAHRGDKTNFPENTTASFDAAVAMGVDAIEFDVRLTRDGQAVVIHDPTLERTTDGRGEVRAHSLRELQRFDAGARFAAQCGTGLRVLTLAHVLERYSAMPMLIEVKLPEAVPETLRLLRAHGLLERVLVDSTDRRAVEPFRGVTETGASLTDCVALLARTSLPPFGVKRVPYDALCITPNFNGMPVPVERLARAVRRIGVPTHVWTVNDPVYAARLWSAGIEGILSDDPGVMMVARERLGGGG
ncbi:MAG: glycerophosphoryl diester phosphodiesterase [Gemmatimonadetes bacterium]|nr:glycerophosphoryl diester phosphodiesterase [Gemmatimonadota bacterium]